MLIALLSTCGSPGRADIDIDTAVPGDLPLITFAILHAIGTPHPFFSLLFFFHVILNRNVKKA